MIVKSSLFKVPIIVSDEHLMGELVQKYRLGLCVENAEPETILKAIDEVLNRGGDFEADFSSFNKHFSVAGLEESLSPLLVEAELG